MAEVFSMALLPYALGAGGVFVGIVCIVLMLRARNSDSKGEVLGLQHIVTLNSGGWLILSAVSALGALVMILSSAAIGIDYWTGLAVNADRMAGKIPVVGEIKGLGDYLTTGVISFFVLALFLELFSDLGTPLSSGFKQRKNNALARLVLIATVGCVAMSLATKWGYYDDKTNARRVDAVKTTAQEQALTDRRDDAQGIIDRLEITPPQAVLNAMRSATEENIELLERQLTTAERALAEIPASHSTNRLKAGEAVSAAATKLSAARIELAGIRQSEADLVTLATARDELKTVEDDLKEIAGKVGSSDEGGAHTPIGDLAVVRLLRVALHQFLCFLFPLVFFESTAAFGDTRKKEEANKKRRQTLDEKANTIDVPSEDVRAATPGPPPRIGAKGYYDDVQSEEAKEVEELKRQAKKRKGDPRDDHPASPRASGYRNGTEEPPEDEEAMNNDDD